MLKFQKRIALITFLALAALIGCAKNGEVPSKEKFDSSIEKIGENKDLEKIKKMKRFISISWGVPLDDILFDGGKNEFSFGEVKMSKDEIEKLYDISNEYKLKYE